MQKHDKNSGHATTIREGGMGYREIAHLMSQDGQKMNHNTARNYVIRATGKIARQLCKLYQVQFNDDDVRRISMDPSFQDGLCTLMQDIYCSNQESHKE